MAEECLLMKSVAILFSFVLLFGCALPGQEPTVAPQPQPTPVPEPEINVSIGNGAALGDENASVNAAIPGGDETEEEILPEVPRNVSGGIMDGQFAIRENYA